MAMGVGTCQGVYRASLVLHLCCYSIGNAAVRSVGVSFQAVGLQISGKVPYEDGVMRRWNSRLHCQSDLAQSDLAASLPTSS